MSAASDDDLAAHERSAGGHGHVVLLAFPARPAVEGDLLRDPVDALQDREGVAGQGHAAHALSDLALHNPEARLRDGLERPADRIFHPTDPLARQHAGLRLVHDLVLLVAARAEVRVRHAHPDPAADVLRPAVARGAGLQHAGRLEAVQETAINAAVDDRGLVGRRPFRVEWDGAVGPGIGAVVVNRDQRRFDLLARLVREEGALLDDLVALGCVAHDFMCQQTGNAGIRYDRHEARRRLRRAEHLDGLLREAPPERREVERLDEFPARGPVAEVERGLAAIAFAGDRLTRDPDADLPPFEAGAPCVREFERPVGVCVRGVRVRDLLPLLGSADLHRGGDLLFPGDVARLDPDLRFQRDRGGWHLAELRRRHAGRGPTPGDRDGLPGRLDRVGRPAGRPGCIAPRSVDEGADAPAPTVDLVDALDLFVRDAYDERRAILRADVAEARARLLEGPHRGGHELRHGRPRRRAAIKGFRAPGRDAPPVPRGRASLDPPLYIIMGHLFYKPRAIARTEERHAVIAPAVSRSAVLPDGHGELVEEAICAGAERARPPGHLARHDHRDLNQRPQRARVRALPHDLRRAHRRVREHRGRARVEADVRHAEPWPARLGRPRARLHDLGPHVDRPVGGLTGAPGSPRRTPARR